MGGESESQAAEGGRDFPPTSWSIAAGFNASDSGRRDEALIKLCERYQSPIYHYVRCRWRKSTHEAEDLKQEFLAWVIKTHPLRKYDPKQGRFRPYLKSLLWHFEAGENDKRKAKKRGGEAKKVPLVDGLVDSKTQSPDEAFEEAWKQDVLKIAQDRARQWFVDSGRSVQWRCYEEKIFNPDPKPPTDAQIARGLGIKEDDVGNYLRDVRKRIEHEGRAELSQTVSDREQLDAEYRNLLGG